MKKIWKKSSLDLPRTPENRVMVFPYEAGRKLKAQHDAISHKGLLLKKKIFSVVFHKPGEFRVVPMINSKPKKGGGHHE